MRLQDIFTQNNVLQRGNFTLTSGAQSTEYINLKRIYTDPIILKSIAGRIADHIDQSIDLIAGMELGSIPLVVASSLVTYIPFVMVRKDGRSHGSSSRIEGRFNSGSKAVIIEDVTTTGKSVIETIHILKEAEIEVSKVITVVDREMGASKAISNLGVEFVPLTLISQLK